MKRALSWSVLLCVCMAVEALGGVLSIRLAHVTEDGPGRGEGLEDVSELLSRSLVYKGHRLVAQTTVPLPVHGVQRQLGKYEVHCAGSLESLAISIRRGSSKLLNTTVHLKPGRPLILGGFPAEDGRMVFVFVALGDEKPRIKPPPKPEKPPVPKPPLPVY